MKTLTTVLAALALACTATTSALADTWPSKPVTLLVPFPPGGSTDMIARTLAPKLQEKLGGSFIVSNQAGAGGTVGAAAARRAAPDGYTVFVSSLGPLVFGPLPLLDFRGKLRRALPDLTVKLGDPQDRRRQQTHQHPHHDKQPLQCPPGRRGDHPDAGRRVEQQARGFDDVGD